jgi:hypothetical protein
MTVFGARGGDQHVRVAFSFIDSAYYARAATHLPFYLCLQRYVWRSLKGRLGPLYKNGLLVSRATRAKLAGAMGVSHDTVDRELRWLVKEGWLQKTYHHKRLHFVLGKWSTSSKSGKAKEMYLAEQVVRAHIQAEQAEEAAAVVSELAEPANAPQHPQNCVVTTPGDASQHPQNCGQSLRKNADTPSARLRMMNREEKNREPGIANLPYREGSALARVAYEKAGGVPSAVSLNARSASRTDEQKTSTEKEVDQNKYAAPSTSVVSDVAQRFMVVAVPVESQIEEPMPETPEQRAKERARQAALRGQPQGEIIPPDTSAPEPATKPRLNADGDEVPAAPKALGRPAKRSGGLKGELYAYSNTHVPDPDTIDRAPNSTLGFAKFVETVIKKHFPNAVVRPDKVDFKWCKDLLAQFTTEELYEMVMLLTLDWTNINHGKEFFPPGGDHPVIKDLFRHRALLATYIGKGYYVVPNYRTSAYQADYARRHGGVSVGGVPHVVTEEERIKRLRDQLNK